MESELERRSLAGFEAAAADMLARVTAKNRPILEAEASVPLDFGKQALAHRRRRKRVACDELGDTRVAPKALGQRLVFGSPGAKEESRRFRRGHFFVCEGIFFSTNRTRLRSF